MTDQDKLTIVIPTKNRCRTLEHTLRTCVAQEDENLEILVSDNFSQDQTREMVAAFRDRRLRYVNTGRPLGMSENWDFALSQVTGALVSYIGDDDGFLPGAVTGMREAMKATGCRTMCWATASYHWPDCVVEDFRNILRIPLRTSFRHIDSRSAIAEVVAFTRGYTELPCIYHGVAELAVLKQGARKSGRFFNSISPDVYSGFAIAAICGHYVRSEAPFTVSGVSASSTGTATFTPSQSAQTQQAVEVYLQENALTFHPRLDFCPSLAVVVTECYLQAQDHVPEMPREQVDVARLLEAAANDAAIGHAQNYRRILDAIRSIGVKNGLAAEAEQLVTTTVNRPRPVKKPVIGGRIHGKSMTMDCSLLGIRDVHLAAAACRTAQWLKQTGALSMMGLMKTTIAGMKGSAVRKAAGWLGGGNKR